VFSSALMARSLMENRNATLIECEQKVRLKLGADELTGRSGRANRPKVSRGDLSPCASGRSTTDVSNPTLSFFSASPVDAQKLLDSKLFGRSFPLSPSPDREGAPSTFHFYSPPKRHSGVPPSCELTLSPGPRSNVRQSTTDHRSINEEQTSSFFSS